MSGALHDRGLVDDLPTGYAKEHTGRSTFRSPPREALRAVQGVSAVAGEVRTLNDQPLAGVTLRIEDRAARTDETGRFLLPSVLPGRCTLLIDGRTASRPEQTYGVFEVGVDVKFGRL